MKAGSKLRTARMENGLSLEQMSSLLKVKLPVLAALEEGDTASLPPQCYVRGYLRTYAGEVGLDPEEITAEYMPEMVALAAEQRAAQAQAEAAAAEAKLRRRYALREHAQAAAERERQAAHAARVAAQAALAARSRLALLSARERFETIARSKTVMAAAAVLLVALLLVAITPSTNRAEGTGSAPASVATPAAEATESVATQSTATNLAATSELFRIELVASRSVFVSATADGQSVLSRELHPGERQVLESSGRLVLRVSDPAVIAWSVNGKPGRRLGTPGQSVTVEITGDTLGQFVAMN